MSVCVYVCVCIDGVGSAIIRMSMWMYVFVPQALQSGDREAVMHNLENITPDGFFVLERSLLIAVVETRKCAVVDAVLQVRQKMAAQSEDQEERKHDFDWLCEAASKVCTLCNAVMAGHHTSFLQLICGTYVRS